MDKRAGNSSSTKPLIGMLLGIWVLIAAAYFAFSGNEPKKPIWDENDRRVTTTGSESSVEDTGSTTATSSVSDTGTSAINTGSSTVPQDMLDTPAGRDARDSDSTDMTGATGSTGSTSTGAQVTEYWNEALGYGFSLPRAAYYMGTGPRDDAAHSMAIKMGSEVTDFESADIKVWFFPRKLLPEIETSDTGFYQDTATSRTYLKLGSGTLMIEGDLQNSALNMIIQTARVR